MKAEQMADLKAPDWAEPMASKWVGKMVAATAASKAVRSAAWKADLKAELMAVKWDASWVEWTDCLKAAYLDAMMVVCLAELKARLTAVQMVGHWDANWVGQMADWSVALMVYEMAVMMDKSMVDMMVVLMVESKEQW